MLEKARDLSNAEPRPSEPGDLRVTMAIADYDRTRPLIDGRVKQRGIDLVTTTASIPEFCLVPVYEQYDFAEMSLSWYLMAHCRAELAAYKVPRLMKFISEAELPLTVTGKLQKNRLADFFTRNN